MASEAVILFVYYSKTYAGHRLHYVLKLDNETSVYICMYVWSSHIAEYGSTQ